MLIISTFSSHKIGMGHFFRSLNLARQFNKKTLFLINKNKSIFYFKNSKLIKKIKFPFAYLFTYKIFENYMIKNKKNSIIKNFNFVSLISREIVKKIEKIKIT